MLKHKARIYESLLKKYLINWGINTSKKNQTKQPNKNKHQCFITSDIKEFMPLVRITWKTEETSQFCGECMEVPTEFAGTATYLWAAAPGSRVVTLWALSKWSSCEQKVRGSKALGSNKDYGLVFFFLKSKIRIDFSQRPRCMYGSEDLLLTPCRCPSSVFQPWIWLCCSFGIIYKWRTLHLNRPAVFIMSGSWLLFCWVETSVSQRVSVCYRELGN